uniref:HORMA domain-containing protein n=1 Tax=Kalanchoe fedtschenkoi TaxID=63787 RepID=A0A7N0RJH4_KALFE
MERLTDDQSPTFEIARFLVEFLEVAVTSIVYLKAIYPAGAFERQRYLNLVVHRARHPQLKHYIHSTVTALLPYLQKGLVERLAVSFFSPDDEAVERFVFKFALNLSLNHKSIESELEVSVKSFLVKLLVAEPITKPLPKGCRWEITCYFRILPQASTSEDVLWIPSNGKQWQHLPLITPVKSMTSDAASVQLYLEHPNTTCGCAHKEG